MAIGFRECTTVIILIAAVFILGTCDGPNERAGRIQDRAAAMANDSSAGGEGIYEAKGRALDRAQDAAEGVRDAKAAAMEKQADQMRTEADIAADRLDAQARKIRTGRSE